LLILAPLYKCRHSLTCSLSLLFILPNKLSDVHPCMPVIPLVPSVSPTLIFSPLRLSAYHLALAVSASQPLKFATLSLHLSVPVPVLIPSGVTSRPTTASRPSNMLNPFLLVPQMRLLLTTVHVYHYLLTYSSLLHTCMSQWPSGQRVRLRCQRTQVRISPPTVAFLFVCLFVCLIVCLFINPHQERETQFHKRSTI